MPRCKPSLYLCRRRPMGNCSRVRCPPGCAGPASSGGGRRHDVSAGSSDREAKEIDELKSATAALLPRLRRFGIMLSGSAIEADDLVQAACLRAFERIDQLRLAT